MKALFFRNAAIFIASLIGVTSCLSQNSFLSLGGEASDLYILLQPTLSKVYVGASLKVKSLKYCFSEKDKCSDFKVVSDPKPNNEKTRNIFTLPNPDRLPRLVVEASESEFDAEGTKKEKGTTVKRRIVELSVSDATKGGGGKTGSYEATYGSSTYKIVVPSSYNELDPAGVMIYLHGDNANDYYQDWLFKPLAEFSGELNMITVSVKTPDSSLRWYVNAKQNADYLFDLIENRIFKDFNVNKNRIYFTGSSGGSQFLTGIFVSRYVGKGGYGGGAIPVCGGADIYKDSQTGGMEVNVTDKIKKGFKLFYYTGTGDFLYDNSGVGVKYSMESYKKLGFTVGGEHPAGATHCQNDSSVKITPLEGVKKAFDFFYKS